MTFIARCVQCSTCFTEADLKDQTCCPQCDTTSIPCDPKEDILLPINWHEVRLLTTWASRWADRMDDLDPVTSDARASLAALLKRIDKHRPVGGGSLTLVEEVKNLQKEFPGAELRDSNGEILISEADIADIEKEFPFALAVGYPNPDDSSKFVTEHIVMYPELPTQADVAALKLELGENLEQFGLSRPLEQLEIVALSISLKGIIKSIQRIEIHE